MILRKNIRRSLFFCSNHLVVKNSYFSRRQGGKKDNARSWGIEETGPPEWVPPPPGSSWAPPPPPSSSGGPGWSSPCSSGPPDWVPPSPRPQQAARLPSQEARNKVKKGPCYILRVLLHNVDAHNINVTGRACYLT
jgi:hypothetical protein